MPVKLMHWNREMHRGAGVQHVGHGQMILPEIIYLFTMLIKKENVR